MGQNNRYISETLRFQTAAQADHRCEYCLQPERASFIKFQIDHVISLKHGGLTISDNLAFVCPICNNCKGSDVGILLLEEDIFIRLYNPRKDTWTEHFEVFEGVFVAKNNIGVATIKVLNLNHINRILERLDLIKAGLYP